MRGVNGGRFLNHAVEPNRHGFDRTGTEEFVNGDHHFLASTDSEHGTNHLAATHQGAGHDVLEFLIGLLARGLIVARRPVG